MKNVAYNGTKAETNEDSYPVTVNCVTWPQSLQGYICHSIQIMGLGNIMATIYSKCLDIDTNDVKLVLIYRKITINGPEIQECWHCQLELSTVMGKMIMLLHV
jgi:hypothetical protein